MESISDALAPFQPYLIDDRHRELLPRLLVWSMESSQLPDPHQHAKRAFLASTFGYSCAPRSAPHEEVFISTKFLMYFFLIDDALSPVLDDLVGSLGKVPSAAPAGPQEECLAYYHALTSELRERGSNTEAFEQALRDILLAMQREKRSNLHDWSFDQLLEIRKLVIGIPAFTECWRSIRNLTFTPSVAATIRQSQLLNITCETACIINDLASLARDEQMMSSEPEAADPNLVLVRMRELGDRDAAIEEAIDWYNRKVHEFHRVERSLLGGDNGSDPSLVGYLEILRCAIEGDLAASKSLAPLRYEGASKLLEHLVRLDQMS